MFWIFISCSFTSREYIVLQSHVILISAIRTQFSHNKCCIIVYTEKITLYSNSVLWALSELSNHWLQVPWIFILSTWNGFIFAQPWSVRASAKRGSVWSCLYRCLYSTTWWYVEPQSNGTCLDCFLVGFICAWGEGIKRSLLDFTLSNSYAVLLFFHCTVTGQSLKRWIFQ